jgi:hypothetical protein
MLFIANASMTVTKISSVKTFTLNYSVDSATFTGRTMDKLGIPSRPGSRSTVGSSNFTIWINQLWQSTAVTWATASSLMTPKSWPINRDVIELHPDNINRVEGFSLRKSWKPLIRTLNDCRKALSRHK